MFRISSDFFLYRLGAGVLPHAIDSMSWRGCADLLLAATAVWEKILTFAFEWEVAEGVALLKGEASKSRRDTSNESTMTKEYRLIWKNILLLKRPPAGATLTGKADVFDSINDGEENMREPSKSTGELVDR